MSSTTTAVDRIEALASSRRSPDRSCGLRLQSSPVKSADGTDSEASFTSTAWLRESDRVCAPHRLARFCKLRNAIVHGDEVPENLWMHEGHHHLAHAHDALIRCLKSVVAVHADDPLLKMTRSERVFPRKAEEMAERLR
jgi:hypothetical protein